MMNTNAPLRYTFGRLMNGSPGEPLVAKVVRICLLVALAALAGCEPPSDGDGPLGEVSAAVGNGPTITGQPQSMMVNAGQSAYFFVTDTSNCGLIHNQWQFNGVNLSDGGGISGSQTGILQLSGVTAAQAGSYRIVLTCANGTGYTISQAATLTVNQPSYPTGLPPFITNLGWSGCSGSACTIWWMTTGATK